LTNIIENALHAMPGGGRLAITATAASSRLAIAQSGRSNPASGRSPGPGTASTGEPAGTGIIVEITDSGVGMDQEAIGRIFEPYFSTKATGTGLGLTIAKRNIELNGGAIEVRSQRGVGTTVTITIPAVS
jgi:signal transduction histidine kinase